MDFRKFDDCYVLRIDKGEELIASLTEFCKKENVKLASVQGLGASDHAVVGLFDAAAHKYRTASFDEPMEITSLTGSISTKDGEPYLHIHSTFGRGDMSVVGGHLSECRISLTCELFIKTLNGRVERRLDEEKTGLNLYHFE